MERPVLLETSYEARIDMYEDLREMLCVGFLAQTIEVGGVLLSLRSLYPSDMFLLKHRVGPKATPVHEDSWLVASSVWMVDGQPIAGNWEAAQELQRMFKLMPGGPQARTVLRKNIGDVLKALQRRANATVDVLESFIYEGESRNLWRSYGPRINRVSGLGFDFGYNTVQRLWIAHNEVEDRRDRSLQDWDNTKCIMATMGAADGMKKITQADENSREEETRRRQQVHDVAYARWRGLPLPKDLLGEDGRVTNTGKYGGIKMLSSVSDLYEEMDRVQRGIKDDHDKVIDAYKQHVRGLIEKEERERQERVTKFREQMFNEGFHGAMAAPMSPEALAARLKPKHTHAIHMEDGRKKLYDKYVKKDPIAGGLQGQGGRFVGVPTQSLSDRLSERKPQLGDNENAG